MYTVSYRKRTHVRSTRRRCTATTTTPTTPPLLRRTKVENPCTTALYTSTRAVHRATCSHYVFAAGDGESCAACACARKYRVCA